MSREVCNDLFLNKLNLLVNAEENPVKYLSIDPGESSGICGYDERCHLVMPMWTISDRDVVKFINTFKYVTTCICESYRVYNGKQNAHVYSDLKTTRVIGRIEYWTEINKIKLVMQPAKDKATGYKFQGIKPPPKSNPANHEMDANSHFMYFAVRNGLINAADLIK